MSTKIETTPSINSVSTAASDKMKGKNAQANRSSGSIWSSEDDFGEEEAQLLVDITERMTNVDFRQITDIGKYYILGDDVFPSGDGHVSTTKRVCFAKDKESGKTVVVKLRHKKRSFRDDSEVLDWTEANKLFYMLTAPRFLPKKVTLTPDPKVGGNYLVDGTQYMNTSHICKVLDLCEDDKYYYCVMEYVKGRDLFEYFISERPHDSSHSMSFARQLCYEVMTSMDRMHSMGLIHRDIKLENIVFDEEAQKQKGPHLLVVPKIIDFDTCELYRPSERAIHVLGTDQYIAPESYAGHPSPAADVWWCGVILYVFLTGTFPFHAKVFDDEAGENYVGHPRMDQIRRRLRVAKIDWSHNIWNVDQRAKDLVRRCLITEHKRRISCRSALKHPWIIEPH